MNNRIIQDEVLCSLAKENIKYIPAAISNRHVHLSAEHVEALFGKGYKLTVSKPLSQPEQFACNETVEIFGKKGSIKNVRVLGPSRKETQVEITVTDSFTLGIEPVVRCSGALIETPGCMIKGPMGEIRIERGVIVSLRHVHMSAQQALDFGLKNNEFISLKKTGLRETTLEMVFVRCGDAHELELHIDTDEANAAMIKNGEFLEIVHSG
ncbi:MAG: phosphate propanoyltransferase [Eubacteriales bacterium]